MKQGKLAKPAGESVLKVGAARVDITPPVGVELCGYGPYLYRESTGVLDRLFARAVYWEDNNSRMVYIGNDLIGVSAELTERLRQLCQTHLHLPLEAVMVAGTHTHSGPATVELYAWGEKDQSYLERLPHLWLEAVGKAIENARPATMSLSAGPVETCGCDRHDPNGPLDNELRVASFNVDGKPVAILVNHSVHGVVFGEESTVISGDWPGVLERMLEQEYPGAVAAFVQGSCGTINSTQAVLDAENGKPHIEAFGKRFAGEVVKLMESPNTVEGELEVSFGREGVELPYVAASREELVRLRDERIAQQDDATRSEWERNMARLYTFTYQKLIDAFSGDPESACLTEVQVFRVGPLSIVAIPGELFMALGQEIMDYRGDGLTMIAGYANDFLGYFATAKAYGDQAYIYPTQMVPLILGRLPFQKQAGDILVDAAKRLIS